MPDRYADAVRARRAELRAEPGPLAGTHRAELLAGKPAERVRAPRLAGAAEGLAVWRVAFVVLAAMPLVGLPVWGGPALAPVAVGLGAAAVVIAVIARRGHAEQALLRRQVDAV